MQKYFPLRAQSPPHEHKKLAPCDWLNFFKNPVNQKQPALFCFFVIGWCSHIDQSQGTGFHIREMGFVYSRGNLVVWHDSMTAQMINYSTVRSRH